jgi:hypothetical protein
MTDRKTTRVQLELAEKSMDRLVNLKDKTEAASYAEVIKNALRLYENLILKHEEGNRFLLKDRKGALTEYEIFY